MFGNVKPVSVLDQQDPVQSLRYSNGARVER